MQPGDAANRVLDELGISRPEDLCDIELIAFARGAVVVRRPLRGAEARLVTSGGRAVITVRPVVDNYGRERFSIAHELGHLEMHRVVEPWAICTSADIDEHHRRGTKAEAEHKSNEFASALLMPERLFGPMCEDTDPGMDLVASLAETFDTSLTAAALRYVRFCEGPSAVVFSEGGYVRWFQGSGAFRDLGLFVEVKGRVDPASGAARCYRGGLSEPVKRRVKPGVWLAPREWARDARIVEQSWPMPKYNAVLTLVWADEDLEDEDADW